MFQSSCRGNLGCEDAPQKWGGSTLPTITPTRHMVSTLYTTGDSIEWSCSVGGMPEKTRIGDKEPIGGSSSSSNGMKQSWQNHEIDLPADETDRQESKNRPEIVQSC